MLLIVGAKSDHNVNAIHSHAIKHGIDVFPLLLDTDGDNHLVSWDVYENTFSINNQILDNVSACYIRQPLSYDEDSSMGNNALNPANWFFTIYGWLQSNPQIKMLNRAADLNYLNKPYILHLAKEAGLHIPFTLVTNDLNRINEVARLTGLIAKPVNGAGYCTDYKEAYLDFTRDNDASPSPAIIQNKMIYPEFRIFKIGNRYHCFRLLSEDTDYRLNQNVEISYIDQESLYDEIIGLEKLSHQLNLNFLAADFKTCPQSGFPAFLEINNAPMFSVFDQHSGHRLIKDILTLLST